MPTKPATDSTLIDQPATVFSYKTSLCHVSGSDDTKVHAQGGSHQETRVKCKGTLHSQAPTAAVGDLEHRWDEAAGTRWLLIQAAVSILRRRPPQTEERHTWALRIAARRGKQVAVVALARRLAGIRAARI